MSSTLIRLVVVAARPNWSFWISAAVVCTPKSRLSYPNEHDGSLLDASTHFATTSFQSRAHCSLADPSWEWSKWEQERKNWKLWDEKIGFFSSLTRTKLSRMDDEEMKRHTKWPKREPKQGVWNHLSLLLTRRLTRAANPRWMNEASELIRFFLGNLLFFPDVLWQMLYLLALIRTFPSYHLGLILTRPRRLICRISHSSHAHFSEKFIDWHEHKLVTLRCLSLSRFSRSLVVVLHYVFRYSDSNCAEYFNFFPLYTLASIHELHVVREELARELRMSKHGKTHKSSEIDRLRWCLRARKNIKSLQTFFLFCYVISPQLGCCMCCAVFRLFSLSINSTYLAFGHVDSISASFKTSSISSDCQAHCGCTWHRVVTFN